MSLPEPKRDTACFSDRQWFVGECAFSTEEDARQAIGLAKKYAYDRLEALRAEISNFALYGETP